MEENNYTNRCNLSNEDISRYSRQLILPEINVNGQIKLKAGKVLIVGMGGLGCPAALYLAAAGVGTLGLLDYDEVDYSNLHRQILHNESSVGISKVTSASQNIKRLNSSVTCHEHCIVLDSATAIEIVQKYDVVLDASDNVATRYLINDACVLAGKPLVSGSALRFEGQLTVYNYKDGPCYRCLFPKPPPPETVTNCSDGGVIGAVTGLIGSLQALETIKILAGIEPAYSQKLFVFDGLAGDIRVVKLRNKKDNCPVCGQEPTITKLEDYEIVCGAPATDKSCSLRILPSSERTTVHEFKQLLDKKEDHILIDVRPDTEFDICSLSTAQNVPISKLGNKETLESLLKLIKDDAKPIYVICRQGNDSQKAVMMLKKDLVPQLDFDAQNLIIRDIIGGLTAWSSGIDKAFPVY